MPLTKPNQQLRRDLKVIAFKLEQSCVDLGRLASRINDIDAIALVRLVGGLYEDVDKLMGYAEEVNTGRIVRGKADAETSGVNCRPDQNSS